MKIFLLLTTLFFFTASFSQNRFAASAIPAALLKDASVVKRIDDAQFRIVNLHEAYYTHHYALTVLNEAGDDYADFAMGYDKLHKVTGIEGTLYDAAGNAIKKVKNKEVQDLSAVDEISLYDDHRVKAHSFNYHAYPYTVEYTVEVEYSHTFSFPTWMPQTFEGLAVEGSSYSFVCPQDYNVRYKMFRYKGEPLTTIDRGVKKLVWQIGNLPAFEKPYAAPRWNELTTTVYFAPSEFEMEGYKASAASWKDLGMFGMALNAGRDKLPDAVAQKVAQLTAGIADPNEKIKALYDYLQHNTRYISIQLGIGGLQPFDASYVAQKGYGDCKALSNYMYSLLKAAGIKSNYTWIQGGRDIDDRYLMEDFPMDQFNHIVLCVPMMKDTVWLECTSQTEPAGYMGSFTGNRKALCITEEGGKVVSTPRYGVAENVQMRKVKATVDEEGNLKGDITTVYKAEQQDYVSGMLAALSKDKVKKYLNKTLDLSTYDITNFDYKSRPGIIPEVEETLKLSVDNYATVSGKRLFIVPNLMSRAGRRIAEPESRTCDYVFDWSYQDVDSVEMVVPAGYTVEAVPQPQALKTPYGSYATETKVTGDKIMYYRKLVQNGGRFSVSESVAIAKYLEAVWKGDRSKVVLVKKE